MKHFYNNKTFWVVGASDGIGLAIAQKLSDNGAKVILSSRRKDVLENQAKKIANTLGIITIDLEQESSIENACTEAQNFNIDGVFLVGGISQRALFKDVDLKVGRRLFEINFWGHVLLSKLMLPSLLSKKESYLIEISSITGLFGYHQRSFYSATKHAVKGFIESLALEHYKDGLRTLLVYPGKIKTNISRSALVANGNAHGKDEEAHEEGYPAENTATDILNALAKGKKTCYPGGKEMASVKLNKYLPNILFKILLKKSNL